MSNPEIKECIVIAGSHRSGTSALTRLFGISGAAMPANLLKSSEGNETGHWESQPIVDFNDKFLDVHSTAWSDWNAMDVERFTQKEITFYSTNMDKLILQEYAGHNFIALKDPRICRFQSLTASALENMGYTPKFAIITRNPLEVGQSLCARNKLPVKTGILLWLRHVLDSEFYSRGFDRGFATFEQLIAEPSKTLQALWADLNLVHPFNKSAVEQDLQDYVQPKLRHYSSTTEDVLSDESLESWVAKTYAILIAAARRPIPEDEMRVLDDIRLGFNSAAKLFGSVITSHIDKAADDLARKEALLTDLGEKSAALEQQLEAVQGETLSALENYKNEIASIENENRKDILYLQSQLIEHKTTHETNLAELNSQRGELAKDYALLQSQLIDHKTAHENIVADLNNQREVLIEDNTLLQSQLIEHKAVHEKAVTELNRQTEALTKDKALLESQLIDHKMAHENNLAEFDSQREALTKDKALLQSQLIDYKTAHETAIAELNNQRELLTKDNTLLKSQLIEYKAAHETAVADLYRQREALTHDKELLQFQLSDYKASLTNAVAELNDQRKALSKDKALLQSQLIDHNTAREAAVADLTEWKARSEALKEQFDALSVSLIEKTKSFGAEQAQYLAQEKSLRKDLRSARTQVTKGQTTLTKLENTLTEERAARKSEQAINSRLSEDLHQTLANNEEEISALTWRVDNLHGQLVAELASNASKTAQLDALESSTFWKITALPRRLVTMWRRRTILLVGLIAGKEARTIISDQTSLQDAAAHSQSKAVRAARAMLTYERGAIINSDRLKYKLGVLKDQADNELPRITLSAVTYNSERWLGTFFASLKALDYPLEKLSINFVDNGSTDQTCSHIEKFIEENAPQFRKLQLFNRPNLGYGAGHDFGIKHADDDFVLVTNVDIEFYASSLKEAANTAIYDDMDVACWEFRQAPYEHPKYYDPVTMLTNWNAHACVLFRRSAYLKVGGYDKKIFMYGEDVELSYRFRANGWKLRYVPNAVITHFVDLEDTSVRPLQLSGSSSANLLLRYRYGTAQDILAGEAFFTAVRRNETDEARAQAWQKVSETVKKERLYFLRKRKFGTKAKFPFREFDYDDTRPGGGVVTAPYKDSDKKDLPLVSIVTRTHGPSDKFLNNCIASVLNQTYPNIEHIIVEDRTDDGEAIVNNIQDIYGDRIRYFKSPGKGRSECGNYGASQAKGEYICWLDNDDLFFADHVETLMRGFERNPAAVCSYALAWEAIGDNINGETKVAGFNLPESHNRPYDKDRLLTENFIPIQAIIFKKAIFDQVGGFNPDLTYLEDWNLWARYAELGEFVFTPRVTSLYVTPNDEAVRTKRHMELHNAYESVRKLTIKETLEIKSVQMQASSRDHVNGAIS